ncbi:TolC family protein [Halosquirtibacter xylanolyticus]|uniref:TolC family protein n=1 Tax=Halosquirtibacter xylanolyticus TaxID=3374599 RepID=UPI00374A64C1|nr:TolC family protein [Prolixibacteraceae bacterium]
MERLKYILAITISIFCMSTKAQSLNEYIDIALKQNQQLQAKQNMVDQKRNDVDATGLLNDPMITGGYYINPVSTKVGNMQGQIGLEQQLPWVGTLKTERQLSKSKITMEQRSLDEVIRNIIYQTKSTYYEVMRLQIDLGLYKQNLKIYQEQQQWLSQQVANGEASNVDLLRLQLQIEEQRTKIEVIQNQKSASVANFNALLNRTPEALVLTLDHWDELNFYNQTIENHPIIETLEAQEQSLVIQQKLISKRQMPMINLGLNYTFINPYSGTNISGNGDDALMIKMGITLPYFSSKKAKAQHKSVSSIQKSISSQKLNQYNTLKAQWIKGVKMLSNKKKQIALNQKQIHITKSALKLIRTEYLTNSTPYIELLRLEQQLLTYRISLSKNQEEAHQLNAKLEYLK